MALYVFLTAMFHFQDENIFSKCHKQMNQSLLVANKDDDRICKVCGRVCPFPCEMIKHMRTHTGERPFPCPYCPYRATQTNNLKRHIMSNHPDVYVHTSK